MLMTKAFKISQTADNKINRKVAFQLLGLVFLFACLIGDSSAGIIDVWRRYYTTKSFWQNVIPVNLSDYVNGLFIVGVNDSVHYWYGMGQSLIMLPGDIFSSFVLNLFGITNHAVYLEYANLKSLLLNLITFPIFSAGAVSVAFLLLREFEFSLKNSVYGALMLFFGTTFLFHTQIHQENTQLFFLTICGYYLVVRWLKTGQFISLLVGYGSLGATLLFRVTTAADIIAVTFFALLVMWWQKRKHKDNSNLMGRIIILFGASGAMVGSFFFLERLYHFKRFGSWTSNYFQYWVERVQEGRFGLPPNSSIVPQRQPTDYPYTQNRLETFVDLFFSVGKSIFLYESLLVVLLIVIVLRRFKLENPLSLNFRMAFLIACLISFIINFIGYSNITFWSGDWTWGARYFTTPLHMWGLLAVPLFLEAKAGFAKVWQLLIYGLVVLSIFIQIISITLFYGLEFVVYFCENRSHYAIDPVANEFFIGQRILNIVGLFTGSGGRACYAEQSAGLKVPYILPFQFATENGTVTLILLVIWFMLFVWGLFLLFKFVQLVKRFPERIVYESD
jgi:hypothetical protein